MSERVNYGLSRCFKVTLDDQTDLGTWTKCEGLAVEYEVQEVKEGGNNGYIHRLPGRAKYPNLKLTRPIDRDTQKVADWLASVTSDPRRSTAQVTILDGGGGTVATWRLQGIYPVRWTGPTLDAGTNTTALEVLELAHNGFAR
jgi:phage tail-like protein